MTKHQIIEEPCEVKVSCTVLKTNGSREGLVEFNYCWHKKGKNGKPLYKKGKAVISSVGCPQKKVRAVERAIAGRLPHRQILEIIKGDNSPPPT